MLQTGRNAFSTNVSRHASTASSAGAAARVIPEKKIVEIQTPRWRNSMNDLRPPDDDTDDNNVARRLLTQSTPTLPRHNSIARLSSDGSALVPDTPCDAPLGHASRWHELHEDEAAAAAPLDVFSPPARRAPKRKFNDEQPTIDDNDDDDDDDDDEWSDEKYASNHFHNEVYSFD